MAETKNRMVVVTTDNSKRGIFMGRLIKYDPESKTCELADAQMAIYYSPATHGVLGLAGKGPAKGSRISPQVTRITLDGVTAVIDATDDAIKAWRAEPWT